MDAYRALLRSFQRTHDYVTFAKYEAANNSRPLILLRHDIDYSIADALHMAEMEADMGISATYFLLFSAPTYNLLARENITAPRRLCELGHEVGLHYDVGVILGAGGDPRAVLDAQAQLLGQLSGEPVVSIAMHNPSVSGEDILRGTPYINAYDTRFTAAYYSDSCMAWRDNFIAAYAAGDFAGNVQLLIHPCLWTEEQLTRSEKLERIFAACGQDMDCCKEQMRQIWENHTGVREHDARAAAPALLSQSAAG